MDIQISLVPEWTSFIIQIIATLFLFLVVRRFLAKPMRNFLKKRQDFLREEFAKADATNSEAILLKEEANMALMQAHDDANQIVQSAKEEADLKAESVLADAKAQVEFEMNKAQEDIQKERIAMNDRAKQDIASIATNATEKLIKKEIDATTHDALFDEFVNQVGGGQLPQQS